MSARRSDINSTPYAAAPRCSLRPMETILGRNDVQPALSLLTPNTTYERQRPDGEQPVATHRGGRPRVPTPFGFRRFGL